ncbi:hypothetical protein NDU88_010502 [Pleurodeles waltl]|uniref:Uncharacterized protein n=1 Tax=Pleurodeles waltl TaxID=8319 RepID=A0AAV7PYZ4_PLEWA|nr:hypothetical protein NDU88_010502 [Pleurodeles waltl]
MPERHRVTLVLCSDSLERRAEELGRVGRRPRMLGRAAVRPCHVALCARRDLHAGVASRRGARGAGDRRWEPSGTVTEGWAARAAAR